MKTRIRKWEGYRKSIDSYHASKDEPYHTSLEEADKTVLSSLQSSKGAISMEGEKTMEATPYENYVTSRKRLLVFKLSALVICIIGLIFMYVFFVVGL